MFRYAVRCGIKAADFWDMTPKEIIITGEVCQEERQLHLERDLSIAYVASRLVMASKPPKLEALIESTRPKKEQTVEEMLNVVKQLNAMFGGKVKHKEVSEGER